jgi:hypothetical protein
MYYHPFHASYSVCEKKSLLVFFSKQTPQRGGSGKPSERELFVCKGERSSLAAAAS